MAIDESHISVLLRETIDGLSFSPDATVIDATLGSGGHFSAIVEKLGSKGTVLGVDVDPQAVARVEQETEQSKSHPRILFATGNFRDIREIAKAEGIEQADAIVADLGWRVEQFGGDPEKGGGKGFSFAADEPLGMTFGNPETYSFTATDIVNLWREEDISTILSKYGEERYARKIAHKIVECREKKQIETSAELAEIVSKAVRKRGALSQDLVSSFASEAEQKSHKLYSSGTMPARYRHGRIHPATKTFQALRIAVNDELDALKEFIKSATTLLSPKGRLAIISFHSIEDRIVKQAFAALEKEEQARRITKKPITPTEGERRSNPRARSAKLRSIEKIAQHI